MDSSPTNNNNSRERLERFRKDIPNYPSFMVDHNCPNYPDGMFYNIDTEPICTFCSFVWGDIRKHPNWKKLTKEQQDMIFPVWQSELVRRKEIHEKYHKNVKWNGDVPSDF